MLKIDKLDFSFGKQQILKELSLHIYKPGIYCIMAPNGTGKTTLLRLMAGLKREGKNKIFLSSGPMGKHLITQAQHKKFHERLFYFEPETMFYPELSVADHAKLISSLYRSSSYMDEVMRRTGVASYKDKLVSDLSLGMRQMSALVLALGSNAPHIVLDEPINGLDPINLELVKEIMREQVAKGKIIILSSHLLEELDSFVNGAYFLYQGSLLEAELGKDIKTQFTKLFRPEIFGESARAQ